jgi:hypothetical protein
MSALSASAKREVRLYIRSAHEMLEVATRALDDARRFVE